MINDRTRLDILKKVEKGEINLDDASRLLSDFYENGYLIENDFKDQKIEDTIENDTQTSQEFSKPDWSIISWIIPLLMGVILTVFASTWLYQNYIAGGLGVRFWLLFIPFLIGIVLIYFGWVLQTAQWLHIDIRQPKGEKPERIVIGFPVPIKMTAGFLNIIKRFLPKKARQLDFLDMIDAFDGQVSRENPLEIHIEDEDGTKVNIFII